MTLKGLFVLKTSLLPSHPQDNFWKISHTGNMHYCWSLVEMRHAREVLDHIKPIPPILRSSLYLRVNLSTIISQLGSNDGIIYKQFARYGLVTRNPDQCGHSEGKENGTTYLISLHNPSQQFSIIQFTSLWYLSPTDISTEVVLTHSEAELSPIWMLGQNGSFLVARLWIITSPDQLQTNLVRLLYMSCKWSATIWNFRKHFSQLL